MQALRQGVAGRQSQWGGLHRRQIVGNRSSVRARLVKDSKSGAEFPVGQKFWDGEEMHCLGSGTRVKKILMVGVQVYSVGVYVEGERATKELGVRGRGGFFENDGDFCAAVLDGAFGKALVYKLLRDVTGQQFAEAIQEALGPRMQLTGEGAALQQFISFFSSRQLPKGTALVFVWPLAPPGHDTKLEGVVVAPREGKDLVSTAPELSIASPGLARALFELYLGDASIVPDGRAAWAAGARELLDYDRVKREARKAGA